MKYTVALRQTDEGFSARCIELPGCWSQGKDETEAMENITDAIETWLATKAEIDHELAADATLREVVIA